MITAGKTSLRRLSSLLLVSISCIAAISVHAQNISVSITPTTASLLVSGQQQFTATVTNDLFSRGVTWSVSAAGGTTCTGAACGTVSPTSTASGTPTAYNAPATVPPGSVVTVTATSVTDPTQFASATVTLTPAVNNAKLSGSYAFSFNGMRGDGAFVFAGIGRFTADGSGNVINGEVDVNATQYPGPVVNGQVFSGTYAIGSDNRGVMTWNIPSSGGTQPFARLAFVIKADGSAVFTLWDPVISVAEFSSGTFEQADTTAYNETNISGDYAFGAGGFDRSNRSAGLVGRLTADGSGNFSSIDSVLNDAGSVYESVVSLGNYGAPDSGTGRGTIRLVAVIGPMPTTLNFVFYVVNAGKLLVMEADPYASTAALLNGAMLRQNIPSGGFTLASLQNNTVISLGGSSTCNGSTSQSKVAAALLNGDGNGNATLAYDQNCGGISASATNQSGTYTMLANGHSCITVGTTELVAFLVNSNQAFVLGADSSALFGSGEPQTNAPLGNSAVSGTYAGFSSTVPVFAGTESDGTFSADGASPTGGINGTQDTVGTNGPNSGVAFVSSYSVSSSPVNGRGTMSITSGPGGSAAIYVISPSKFVAVPLTVTNPSIMVFQQ